ncbi:hypothetical protein VT84_29060 [Gemmata sp. SH-PL17]|uniref:hypothetical protein n=1 Tax=Gemmata sp. SH-PL17 TaxID=1630693 RepID=UPI00078C9A8A|nr:hypothetical protein [Gemmata sp. SH-PL17]AMV28490.1 hypothetical protein VT84_29060 [Gemmata sp. SH-PL17]
MGFKGYRWLGAVVTGTNLFAAANAAQPPRPAAPPPDLTELAKAKQQFAEKEAVSVVGSAWAAAKQEMARSNRPKAIEILKNAKQNLPASISEATRAWLSNSIDAKVAELEGKPVANPANPGMKLDPKSPEVLAAQKVLEEKAVAERKDVVAGLQTVQQADNAGRTAEAQAEIARLTKLYPKNPSVMALGQNGGMKTRLEDAIAIQMELRDRWVKNQESITRSSFPAINDVEFPKNWTEISERRLKNSTIQLTAKEKQIIDALDKPIKVDFRERPLEEALQDLSNMLGQDLLIDKKSVADLELDLKKGATLQANGLSGRTVLRSILAAQGLTFVVKDEAIQIVTVERSRSLLTTRVYYLGDLIQGVGPFGDLQWGPILNAQQTAANADAIVAAIRKSIDPLSWNGETHGPGSITYDYLTKSIVVRASAEVHYSLGRTFNKR